VMVATLKLPLKDKGFSKATLFFIGHKSLPQSTNRKLR
jgi:hypothetical protein